MRTPFSNTHAISLLTALRGPMRRAGPPPNPNPGLGQTTDDHTPTATGTGPDLTLAWDGHTINFNKLLPSLYAASTSTSPAGKHLREALHRKHLTTWLAIAAKPALYDLLPESIQDHYFLPARETIHN